MSNILYFEKPKEKQAVICHAEGHGSMEDDITIFEEAKDISESLELMLDSSYGNGCLSDAYYYSIIQVILSKFCRRLKDIPPDIIACDSDCLQNILQGAVHRILQAQGIR